MTKVRSHGNSVRDVIIAHVISADAQIYRRGNGKVILGPAGCARSTPPAGKNLTLRYRQMWTTLHTYERVHAIRVCSGIHRVRKIYPSVIVKAEFTATG